MSRRSRPGEIETGFAQSDVAYGAFSGTGVFAGQPPMTEPAGAGQPLSGERASAGDQAIPASRAVADLRGTRVSLDVEGSGTLVDALLILDGFGLAPADLQAVHAPPGRSIDLMAAGELDAHVPGRGLSGGDRDRGWRRRSGARLVPITGAAGRRAAGASTGS